MIFENDFNFGAPHAFNATVFGHTHIDIGHDVVGNLSRKLSTGAQFAAGRCSTAGQWINRANLDFLCSQRTPRHDQADNQ